jgi:hypothetical protein
VRQVPRQPLELEPQGPASQQPRQPVPRQPQPAPGPPTQPPARQPVPARSGAPACVSCVSSLVLPLVVVVGGASPASLASGVQGSRQSGLRVGRMPPMSSGWSVPEIKRNNPTGGSLGPTPAGACLSLPQGPDPARSGFPIRTAGRCWQGPGSPAADRARIGAAGGSGRPGRAGGPPAGGGAAAPSAGDTTRSRDPKTGKNEKARIARVGPGLQDGRRGGQESRERAREANQV